MYNIILKQFSLFAFFLQLKSIYIYEEIYTLNNKRNEKS